MQDMLNNLRARPHDEKMAIATGAGLVVALLLFGIWLVSWSPLVSLDAETTTATALVGLEQSERAREQLQQTVDELSSGYEKTQQMLSVLEQIQSAEDPAFVNFVQLSKGAGGEVLIEQVDIQEKQVEE